MLPCTLATRRPLSGHSLASGRSLVLLLLSTLCVWTTVSDSSAPIRGYGTAWRLGRCHESGSAMTSRATMGERSIPGFAVCARGRSSALSATLFLSLSHFLHFSLAVLALASTLARSLARSLLSRMCLRFLAEVLLPLHRPNSVPAQLQSELAFDGISKGDFATLLHWSRFANCSTRYAT